MAVVSQVYKPLVRIFWDYAQTRWSPFQCVGLVLVGARSRARDDKLAANVGTDFVIVWFRWYHNRTGRYLNLKREEIPWIRSFVLGPGANQGCNCFCEWMGNRQLEKQRPNQTRFASTDTLELLRLFQSSGKFLLNSFPWAFLDFGACNGPSDFTHPVRCWLKSTRPLLQAASLSLVCLAFRRLWLEFRFLVWRTI